MQCPKCRSRMQEENCISTGSYMEDDPKHMAIHGWGCLMGGEWVDIIPEPAIPNIPPASGAGRRTIDGLSIMVHVRKRKEEIAAMCPKSSWQEIKATLRLPGRPETINRAFTRLMCAK